MIVQNVVVSKEVCVTLGAPIARLGVNGEGEGEGEVWIGGDLAAKGFDDTEGSEIRWSSCPLSDPDFEIHCTSTGSETHTTLRSQGTRDLARAIPRFWPSCQCGNAKTPWTYKSALLKLWYSECCCGFRFCFKHFQPSLRRSSFITSVSGRGQRACSREFRPSCVYVINCCN